MNKDALYYGLSLADMTQILEHAHNEFYVVDAQLRIIFVNQALCRALNCQPEDLMGKPISQLDSPLFSQEAMLHCKNRHHRLTWRIHLPDVGDVISTSVPFHDKQGQLQFISTLRHGQFTDMDICVRRTEGPSKHLADRTVHIAHSDFVTHSASMRGVIKLAQRAADSNIALMITGKTGTGKTMMARYIHERSRRSKGPLVYVNCATIPPNLIEAELFGYAPHAFTGACPQGKAGLLEQANGGTLFLDEIAELPINLQAKLLTAIETCRFLPVGSEQYRQTDTRIISATNQDLPALIAEKLFREDLYWRLSAIPLYIPSLEERPEDVRLLIYYYLNLCNQKFNTTKTISHSLFLVLTQYHWPGNVRQLKNTIERFFIVSPEQDLTVQSLPTDILETIDPKAQPMCSAHAPQALSLEDQLSQQEGAIIRAAVETHGSSRKVAQALGLSQTKAVRLIQKYT